jgi:predicted DCC family thiol-disulfide oxidoreductase YuxK
MRNDRTSDHPTYPLTLFYDRRCGVCRLEMDELNVRDRQARLRFVDISAPDFDAQRWGASLTSMNAELHAMDATGRSWRALPAIRLAYAAVGLGWVMSPTAWPGARTVFDALYRWFADNRYGISRCVRPLIERVEAARLTRRMRRCPDDACRL